MIFQLPGRLLRKNGHRSTVQCQPHGQLAIPKCVLFFLMSVCGIATT